jgi:hypothetical protein
MADTPKKLPREKRTVSLEGNDPIEVLKRLLGRPPAPAKPKKGPSKPAN